MAKQPKAGIEVGLDERPAIAGLKRLAKEFGSTAIAINQSMEVAGKVFGAVQAGIGAVVGAMADATRAAMEVERIERRAFAAMQSRAGMSRQEFDALAELNDERERQLNIDADEQLQLQGTLAALGVRKEALNAATEATIGLAEVTGQGLAEAGKKVAQVLGGNVNALKEVGIKARDAADAQAQLQELFALAQAQADTLETRVAAVGHAYGNLQETFGGLVTSSDELKIGLDAVTTALLEIDTYFRSPEGKQAAREFFGVMLELASDTINAFLGLYRVIKDLRGQGDRQGTMSRVGGAFSLVQEFNPTRLALGAITGTLDQTKARIADAYDQLLGRGPNGTDAPILQTLEQLANRLQVAARTAREVQEPSLLHPDGTPYGSKPGDKGYRPPRGGGGGNGGGRSEKEKLSPLRSFTFDQLNADIIEAEKMRQETIEQALQAGRQAEQDYEQQVAEAKRDAMREQWEQTIGLAQELHRRGIEVDLAQGQERLQAQLDQSNAMRAIVQQGAEMVSSGLSSMIANVANGSMTAGDAFKGFVGSLVTSLGTMLLNVGTAAVVLGSLSLIPGLQFITGPTGVGIGAGAAAMVAGAGLIAIGAAMGGGSSGPRTSAPSRVTGGGSMPRPPSSSMGDVVPRGFAALAGASASPYVVNISFSGVVGDERRAARMIEDVLRRGR